MKIIVGADHLGLALKREVTLHLQDLGYEVVDASPSSGESDYPDIAEHVARRVAAGEAPLAVLVCGTGIGMAIAANKVPGIRAANVADPYSAERARGSNNAQILCLGAKIVSAEVANILVDHWLHTEFQGGNSARKVDKIGALDQARTTPVPST